MGTVRPVRLSSLTAPAVAMALCTASIASAQTQPPPSDSTPAVGYSLRAGFEVAGRWFVYSDPLVIATNLRPYDVTGVTLLNFGGSLRPFAWSHVPVLERAGIGFDYGFAPTLDSSTNDGQEVRTSWDHGDLTLHVPVRLGTQEDAPQLAAVLGYGWIGFSFATNPTLAAEVPSVTYRFARLGLHGEMSFRRRFYVTAAFDYLGAFSGGSVYDRFRDVTLNGIDAQLGAGIDIAEKTRLSVFLDYRRFFSSFVPIPGDAYVAGGALDQFGSIKVGIDYGR